MGPLGAAVCFCLSTQGGHEDTLCLPTLTTAMNGGQGLIRVHCRVAWELGLTKGRYMTQRQAEFTPGAVWGCAKPGMPRREVES